MRNLIKNKSKLYGLRYKGTTKVVDSSGNYTGETAVEYYTAQTFYAHISGARGSSQSEIFGTEINYDLTFVLTKDEFDKLGFDENTVFFIEKALTYKDDTPLYNYRVSRIAKTLNEVVVAVMKVSD